MVHLPRSASGRRLALKAAHAQYADDEVRILPTAAR